MIKDIKYNGYTAQPSDYAAPDGSLAASFNLINEDGDVHPIMHPQLQFKIPKGYKLLLIHSTPTSKNYIFTGPPQKLTLDIDFYGIYYFTEEQLKSSESGPSVQARVEYFLDKNHRQHIVDYNSPVKVTAITGNIISLAMADDMTHLFWKEGSYIALPQLPPFIPLEFALGCPAVVNQGGDLKDGIMAYRVLDENGSYTNHNFAARVSDNIECNIECAVTDAGEGHWVPIATGMQAFMNAYMGVYNRFRNNNMAKSRFVEPFFVVYALRMFDGSHVQVSQPILMNPPCHTPFRKRSYEAKLTNNGAMDVFFAKFSMDGDFYAYNLLCRKASVASDALAQLSKWEHLVEGIEVFVSAPIYRHKVDGTPKIYWDTTGATAALVNIPINNDFAKNVNECHTFYHYRTIKLETLLQEYAYEPGKKKAAIPVHSDSYSGFVILHGDPQDCSPNILATRATLKELPSMAADSRIPNVIWSYNSRLIMGDISTRKGKANPITSCYCMNYKSRFGSGYDYIGAKSGYVELFCHDAEGWYMRRSNPAIISSFDHLPPWWFFADTNARFARFVIPVQGLWAYAADDQLLLPSLAPPVETGKLELKPADGVEGEYNLQDRDNPVYSFWVELSKHDFLSGSYAVLADEPYTKVGTDNVNSPLNVVFYEGPSSGVSRPVSLTNELYASLKTISDSYPLGGDAPDFIRNTPSMVASSEVNNPIYFPLSSFTTVSGGTVLAFSSAAKALSQGQFGQFPLYAFTDEGIWALELAADGVIFARQPITRDVLLRDSSPLQIDSAVVFASDRGIMLISGSQTSCISDAVNSEHPFDVLSLPAMTELHATLGHITDGCLHILPFRNFLRCCKMLYNYIHQRIIIFSPPLNYAYVYSLKSGLWSTMFSHLHYGVNSYPEAMAVFADGSLVDFSKDTNTFDMGLLVTRPLKLDAPDVLKTMDTVIQRGHFQKGHVQAVLYGSRDLYNWHLVWSSKDHYLRGFRGTPYKYFRIACVTSLSATESLFGATLQFTPRQTNQPR